MRPRVIAALPMYYLPEVHEATVAWWEALRLELARYGVPDLPSALDLELDERALWAHPEVVFMQTCGYPLVRGLVGPVALLGTPGYRADGCEGPLYRSLVLVAEDAPYGRLEDLRGHTCAFSAAHSHSGYNALRALLAPLARGRAFFGARVATGGHEASIAAIRRGEAQVCAVDCVTYALLRRYRPAAVEAVRVLARSQPVPGLPYVTRLPAQRDAQRLQRMRDALEAGFAAPRYRGIREALLLASFTRSERADYQIIARMEERAASLAYAQIR